MQKTIGIMGAGPSGLVLAKEALAHGITPVVFEQHADLGGIWNPKTGKTWDGMRTNLSHFHMGYSDHAWPEATPDFPRNTTVFNYLKDYAQEFRLEKHIQYEQKIGSVSFSGKQWQMQVGNDKTPQTFDLMGFSSGVFSKPAFPAIKGIASFEGDILHSGDYKNPSAFKNKENIVVVGDSFSAFEICADLAEAGIPSTQVLKNASWILPRRIQKNGQDIPMDITSFTHNRVTKQPLTPEQQNAARIQYFLGNFGDPGDIRNDLRPSRDPKQPLRLVISDRYLDHVKNKMITPYCHGIEHIDHDGMRLASSRHIYADSIIFCTGFEADLNADDNLKSTLAYNTKDMLQPMLLNRSTLHPHLPGATFVGMYRGPYFGVMEMQARWGMGIASGEIEKPTNYSAVRGLMHEAEIRRARPRPHFPRPDYVEFMHNLAEKMAIVPKDLLEQASLDITTPMIPADFRRTGVGANPKMAEQQRKRVLQRLSE